MSGVNKSEGFTLHGTTCVRCQAEGIARAKERGVKFGRPQKMSLAEFEERYYKYCSAGYTVKEMAKMFNMSVSSAYRYKSKLKD